MTLPVSMLASLLRRLERLEECVPPSNHEALDQV